jgi:hypothetical protein
MSGQELYKTLFGKEVANKIQLIPSAAESDPKAFDSNGKRLLDRFEHIENNPCTSSVYSLFKTGNGLYAYSYRINHFKTDDDFVRYFGDIGRRLDEAFAQGKFTEDEYNQLNASFAEYIAEMKTKSDYRRAELELANSRKFTFETNQTASTPEEDVAIAERFMAEKQKAIDSILNRAGFRVEFEKIMEMINQYRNSFESNLISAMLPKSE